ncbi:putative Yif1 family protein [Helianthus debilis subsp. tardiflorus]
MYEPLENPLGGARPPSNTPQTPFGNPFYGASSVLIRGGLGAYGEKILGSSSEYMQSNISRYFSDPQYYFQVNDHYVRNQLKVVLFPFPAQDLYIPLMAFGIYVVLAGFSLGLQWKFFGGGRFRFFWVYPRSTELALHEGNSGLVFTGSLLKMSSFSLGGAEAPLLDIITYAWYAFTGLCLAVLGRIIVSYSYYFLMSWTCLCMGIFLVKTMKRVLCSEVRSFDSSRHHYLLLFIALAQFPLFIWLRNITLNWLF